MKFPRVLVLEVESANDKHPDTPEGKYRRDTPWLVEAFEAKGVQSAPLFITSQDTADILINRNPNTAFLGRVNPMDYPEIAMEQYVKLLTGLKDAGCLLGPDVEHMDVLGSKMILYRLRNTALGVDGIKLHEYKELEKNEGEIDEILSAAEAPRVLKMMRGSTGLGVWKLENVSDFREELIITDAYTQTSEKVSRREVIPRFLKLCSHEDAISMPFLPLIKDGEVRFLMSRDKVLEIVHKRPIDESAFTATLRSGAVYTTLSLEENAGLVESISVWAQDIKAELGLGDLPYWWSVDCIEENGLKPGQIASAGSTGRRLVLSEINCSCLGLVADTSPEARQKGLRLAGMIADIVLN